MNKEGKYDIKEAYKISETMMKGDDKRIENGKKLADLCSKGNNLLSSHYKKWICHQYYNS